MRFLQEGAVCVVLAVLACYATVASSVHPVVFFPGYSLSVFKVTVSGQTSQPGCPASGNYALHYQAAATQDGFDLTCMTNLLALNYDNATGRFSEQSGVNVVLENYGHPACAPFYEPFFAAMENAGLVRNSTLLSACYDWRMAPNVDVIAGTSFMADTRELILRAYEAANKTKVYLVGHSNGPIVAQYFLLHCTAEFRDKYIGNYNFSSDIAIVRAVAAH
jgi:lysophospholipase-3